MKKIILLIAVLFAVLPVKADKDFPLVLHVTAVEMHQGTTGISGSIVNGTGDVDGGRSYTWQLYLAKIDGDSKIYGLRTVRWGSRKWSLRLSINDYRARWTKRGQLEVQVADEKGRMFVLTEEIMSER
jgi:hypothetical protein